MKFSRPTLSALLLMLTVSTAGSSTPTAFATPLNPSLQRRQLPQPQLVSPPPNTLSNCKVGMPSMSFSWTLKIGNCNKLSALIRLPPTADQDPSKIEANKAMCPGAVNCLCRAASQSEREDSWIERCVEYCTGAVEKPNGIAHHL